MNPWAPPLAILLAVAVAVGAMSLVRRRAPDGGFFSEPGHGTGVFGVIGTAFAVLLAFVILLALQTHASARSAAGREAIATTQLYRTTALLPDPTGADLRGALVCYARAVVEDEWETMDDGRESAAAQGWVDTMTTAISSIEPEGNRAEVGYSEWFSQDANRREGRRGRLADAESFVPPLLWGVLLLGAVLVVGYVLLFANHSEAAFVQCLMIWSLAALVAAGMVVVAYLDRPYAADGSGGIRPTEMRRTLALIERTSTPRFDPGSVPCDIRGQARR